MKSQEQIKTPKQALNPAYLKQKPERKEIELFKKELISVLDKIADSESEEFHKNLIIEFLKTVYYKDKYYINTKGRADLVIHNGKDAQSSVGVLIEVKKPMNKAEMSSRDNLNKKSFQELVLYYLRERKTSKNFELRWLVMTNVNEWFIFDAQDFEKFFYQNKSLLNKFEQFENKKLAITTTDQFYKEIATPEIEKVKSDIPYTYFNIQDYNTALRNEDPKDDKKLIALYKLFSPTHLLKLPFANDYNQLNKDFYAELLHILGLEEVKKQSQKFIVRKKEDKRDAGSIIENAIIEIDSTGKGYRLHNRNQFGDTYQDQLFNIALNLSITWINRILFLKLLESQIIKYHDGDKKYSFLSHGKLNGYDELNTLFFQVLARTPNDRSAELKAKYTHVPYLNSSLFESTELEMDTIVISNLSDSNRIKLYPRSVLRTGNGSSTETELAPLDYLLQFLDAYDFSSEGSEEIQEEDKPLISASVLGLIFEKINGYKDGSFFTPSFITMFMCRDTIKRTVLQKFNEAKKWNCTEIVDLYNRIHSRDCDIKEANEIFNTIRICDPAVGSGHFLVSALNELIALKSELDILTDKEGKSLYRYRVVVENDELIVSDDEYNIFRYIPNDKESQRVQETIFQEKRTLIENCLFGVDINPNSVKICQLRLWIELLKHTYYDPKTKELQTLPNIDINIKCGNSLISRFALNEDLTSALRSVKHSIADYKRAVNNYQNAHSKEEKYEFKQLIAKIKDDLRTEISKNDKHIKCLSRLTGEREILEAPDLFELTAEEKKARQKQIEKNKKEIEKCQAIIDEMKNNKIYQNAIEWRFEFPEILNDAGNFIGFDAIIGNPPYIQLQTMGAVADAYKQMDFKVYKRTGDIYCLFYEQGNRLLRPNGYLSFITSNKWMRTGYGQEMRQYIVEHTNPVLMIDFAGFSVFSEATVDVNILTFQKASNRHATTSCRVKHDFDTQTSNLSDYLSQCAVETSFNEKSVSSFVILSSIERSIKEKIEKVGTPLKDWDINIYRGILTGFNEAFIIDGKKRQELIDQDPKSEELIRPILRGRDIKRYGYDFADLWLLFVPWHFPLHNDSTIVGASEEAEIAFKTQYPAVYNHLLQYKKQLSNRNKAETGIRYEWYALQRWGANYWQDFSKPKIIYPNMTKFLPFYFDIHSFTTNQKCFIITGQHLSYLTAFLNSSIFKYCLKDNFPELLGGTRELSKIFFEKIPVMEVDDKTDALFEIKVAEIQALRQKNKETKDKEIEIDHLLFDLYKLTDEERQTIGFIEIT